MSTQPTKRCDKCQGYKSRSNFASHYRRCTGERTKMTKKEINRRYFTNHKNALQLKYQTRRATEAYNKMNEFKQRILQPIRRIAPRRPIFRHPPMSNNCPFFLMRNDEDLFINTAKTILAVHDQFSKDTVGSKKYMRMIIMKCHPDKFATNIYSPQASTDMPTWIAAVQHFSSTLINISNIESADPKFQKQIERQRDEFFACLEASRPIVEMFDKWKQAECSQPTTFSQEYPVEYKRCLDKWSMFLHCDTFEDFFEVWKSSKYYKLNQ